MIPIAKPFLDDNEIKAVSEVLKSGTIAQGPKVRELEEKFARLCGTKYAVAVNSGTAALHTSLHVAGIKKNDEVVTTPFTFIATANTILMQQAKPGFVDIDEEMFNIDPEKIQERINKKTKAIVTVDLYGKLCKYDKIGKIAEDNNLIVVEDACQSVDAELNGKKAGNFGNISAFSFYGTKNITSGEGGMLTTNSEEYAENAKLFRQHGRSKMTSYEYRGLGYNYRATDISAAILLEQLKKISVITKKRIENASYLSENLGKISGIKVPDVKKDGSHVFHQYTMRVLEDFKLSRDELNEHLNKKGIGTGIYYPKPLHLLPHFKKFGYKEGDFPIAEKLSNEVISLPVHPNLTKEQLDYIINAFEELE
ncbi:DegT/DnrJ/EryC1/StrS family aminotransferase [Candidatus Woesearchaeota archaeon]|nr:DegT/DnrJ/EryC1/StrS family aminotransferase [Candidatus Woesearchaeota archaeon]